MAIWYHGNDISAWQQRGCVDSDRWNCHFAAWRLLLVVSTVFRFSCVVMAFDLWVTRLKVRTIGSVQTANYLKSSVPVFSVNISVTYLSGINPAFEPSASTPNSLVTWRITCDLCESDFWVKTGLVKWSD